MSLALKGGKGDPFPFKKKVPAIQGAIGLSTRTLNQGANRNKEHFKVKGEEEAGMVGQQTDAKTSRRCPTRNPDVTPHRQQKDHEETRQG